MKSLPAFALVLIAAGALAGCNETKPAARQNPSRPVLVATVHYAPRERQQSLPGVLKARVENLLGKDYAPVNGYPQAGIGEFLGAEWHF